LGAKKHILGKILYVCFISALVNIYVLHEDFTYDLKLVNFGLFL